MKCRGIKPRGIMRDYMSLGLTVIGINCRKDQMAGIKCRGIKYHGIKCHKFTNLNIFKSVFHLNGTCAHVTF